MERHALKCIEGPKKCLYQAEKVLYIYLTYEFCFVLISGKPMNRFGITYVGLKYELINIVLNYDS